MLLVGPLLALTPATPTSASTAQWLDTNNRTAVAAAYHAEFTKPVPDIGWTGNRQSCNAGTTSQAYRSAVVDRVNYFRAMAGVPANVRENHTWSAQAQQAALSMSASGKLSHNPTASTFQCWNQAVSDSASRGNLYLGRSGPHAITGYIEDPGKDNVSVGHRSWIFHSTLTEVGVGDLPDGSGWASNVLQVIDPATAFNPQPALREADGFVAWPVRGYTPQELVFPRWSFTLRSASFASANVSMTRNGQPVELTVVHRTAQPNGAPFPAIVWEPRGINTKAVHDEHYVVTVSNVSVGNQLRSYSYEVIVMGSANRETVITTHDHYVTAAYRDFLGRTPSKSELSHWNARLSSGVSREVFVATLASSAEWTGFVVDGLYHNTLGRQGDSAGRAYWSAQLQAGMPVAAVAAAFYGSPEYVTRQGGTYDRWLTALYQVLLTRQPDQSGLEFWVGNAPRLGSHTVALDFYQSYESRAARVTDLYLKLLGRTPDAAGLAFWTDVLNSGNDLALAANLAASEEYYRKS